MRGAPSSVAVRSAEAGAGSGPDGTPRADGVRVLLVEDSETQALQIRRRLERDGFAVSRVASAEAALEALDGFLPEIMVLDHHLPGMSGGELLRVLRLNQRTRSLPVLMLTEASEPGLEREGLDNGADAYVGKSGDMGLIALRLRALARRRSGPGADGSGPGESGEAPDAPRFRRARIALVPGGADALRALEAALVRDGHEVRTVDARSGIAEDDCLVLDLRGDRRAAAALCRELDGRRGVEGARILAVCAGGDHAAVAEAFAAGADDAAEWVSSGGSDGSGAEQAIAVRIRAMVRRKLLEDENRRIAAELRDNRLDAERARQEAAANAAKAALAEALGQANRGLADANERLRVAQGKLVQAAKMASLGELVAGIAHEINNPLAFIIGHQATVERLLDRAVAEAPADAAAGLRKARERLSGMGMGLRRIRDLVTGLRRFSRLDESERQEVDVPEAVDTILSLLAHKLGPEIRVETALRAPRLLFCQPALLNQVVMNVVGNAADAIAAQAEGMPPGGGLIQIVSAAETDAAGAAWYRLTVCDNGPGVDEALRERVFEPFFTTKPVGSGTGLGLSIAWSVVRAHDGTIEVDRAEAGGARFTIRVPLRTGERAA